MSEDTQTPRLPFAPFTRAGLHYAIAQAREVFVDAYHSAQNAPTTGQARLLHATSRDARQRANDLRDALPARAI